MTKKIEKQELQLKSQNLGQLNPVQLNVIFYLDIHRILRTGKIDNSLYTVDNSIEGKRQGTNSLKTYCKPGQIINFLIHPLESKRRPSGEFPPYPKILSIVFLSNKHIEKEHVSEFRIMEELKVFGGPDKIRPPHTDVFHYWAGIVRPNLPSGRYFYRLVLEIPQEKCAINQAPLLLNTEGCLSLDVLSSPENT